MITREMILDDAERLGVEPAVVLAVAEVESNGGGFLPDGRPAILFEALWFHKFTNGAFDVSHPNISSATWDRSLYEGGVAEWNRLAEAIALDPEAALKSASWGAFQIMGFNHAACGFQDVRGFVDALSRNLDAQVGAFTAFVQANPPMLQALRSRDWTTFARLYNGPGAVASYAAKIETAWRLHARDEAEAEPPIPDADPTLPKGYVTEAGGNVVLADVKQSTIVKDSSQAASTLAVVGAVGTAGTAVSGFATADWKTVLAIGFVLLLAAGGYALWKLLKIREARLEMSRKGIA